MLTAMEIRRQVSQRNIVIDPFNDENVNPNSYNITLGDEIKWYYDTTFDVKQSHETRHTRISSCGFELKPGRLYLANSVEYTESHKHIPMINGRSSLARLGISVHQTGGFGDIGFCGNWTMEITVTNPTTIYAGVKIAQICWFNPDGVVVDTYKGKYQGQKVINPCKLHEEY